MVVADKLDQHSAYNHSVYWSLLACLVDERKRKRISTPTPNRKNCSNVKDCTFLPTKQDSHKVGPKIIQPSNRDHGHGRNIRCRSQTEHQSLGEYRPTLNQSIHAPRQVKDQSNPKDAPEAQTTGRGKRFECSPWTALHTRQHPQNGQYRLHCGI
jgi:hypothetical protein